MNTVSSPAPAASEFPAVRAERQHIEQVLAQKRQRLAALPAQRKAAQRALDHRGVMAADNARDDLEAELPELEGKLKALIERERITGEAWLQADREARYGAGDDLLKQRWTRAFSALLTAARELRGFDDANRALAQIDGELGRDPDAMVRARCRAGFVVQFGEHLAAWVSRGMHVHVPERQQYEIITDETGRLLLRVYDSFYGGR